MELEVKQISNEEQKPHIDPSKVKERVSVWMDVLKEELISGKRYFDTEIKPMVSYWVNVAKEIVSTKVVLQDVEFLTKDDLIKIIADNKVPGSNGNIVYKNDLSDNRFGLLITYLKDNEIIPSANNVNVSIEADAISRELKELFGTKNIIIVR